jgi:hypothetical protein
MIFLNKRLTYCKDHLTTSVVAWSVFNYDDTDPILAQFSIEIWRTWRRPTHTYLYIMYKRVSKYCLRTNSR